MDCNFLLLLLHRADSLPNTYFSMNLFARADKMFFIRGSQAKKENVQLFQIQVMRSTLSSRNGIGEKFRKYVGPGCFPPPSPVKNHLPVMLVYTSEND